MFQTVKLAVAASSYDFPTCKLHSQLQSAIAHFFPESSVQRRIEISEKTRGSQNCISEDTSTVLAAPPAAASVAVAVAAPQETSDMSAAPASSEVPPSAADVEAGFHATHYGVGCDACGIFPVTGECDISHRPHILYVSELHIKR